MEMTRRRALLKGLAMPVALMALPAGVASAAGDAAAPADDAETPINMTSFTTTHPMDGDSLRLRMILRDANRYGITTWYNQENVGSGRGLRPSDGHLPRLRPPWRRWAWPSP